MKKIIIALSLLASVESYACLGESEICRGDRVIPDSYVVGYAIVKAINPSSGIITVKGNNSSNYHRKSKQELALTGSNNCLLNICVGNKVIPDTYVAGYATVKAINFYKKTYTVLGNNFSKYHRKTTYNLSERYGCLDGVCVGDTVLPDTYTEGHATVKAINFNKKVYTVLGNNSSEYHRVTLDEMSLLEACLDYDVNERYAWNRNRQEEERDHK